MFEFVCVDPEGLSLYNAQTFERISHLEGGCDPIGWDGGEFFCYRDKNAIAWTPETGAVRSLDLGAFGEGDQILHVGDWKGRPSFFFGALWEGERQFSVCALDGSQAETLCSFDWVETTSHQPIVASTGDGSYLACFFGGVTYCFNTSSGRKWMCDRKEWGPHNDEFGFVGEKEHCLLVFGGGALEAYSAVSGQSVEMLPGCSERTVEYSGAKRSADQDGDRRFSFGYGWDIKSLTTSEGTFLVACEIQVYDVEASIGNYGFFVPECETVIRGWFSGPNQRAPVALNPLTSLEPDGRWDREWDLIPSGGSCRLVAAVPGAWYTGYELSKTAREILAQKACSILPDKDSSEPMETSSSLSRSTSSQEAERSSSHSVDIPGATESSGYWAVAAVVSLAAIAVFGLVLARRGGHLRLRSKLPPSLV